MKNYNAFVQAAQTAESQSIFFDACAILFLADHADAPLTIHRLTAATGKTAATLYPALTWLVDRGFLTHTRPAPGRPAVSIHAPARGATASHSYHRFLV